MDRGTKVSGPVRHRAGRRTFNTPYAGRVPVSVHAATVDRFDDVATMLGPKRDPNASVCWCLSHRVPARLNQELTGPARGEFMRGLCRRDIPPGVLAYEGDTVVGWAAIAARAELPISRSRKIPTLDDVPVWSVFCLRVRAGHRGRGYAHALLDGAVAFAAGYEAPVVEGYPVDNGDEQVDRTMAFVGTRRLFEDAGFTLASPTDSILDGFPRVIMRRPLP